MTNVCSDKDSDRSQEEDENSVNHIAFIGSLIYNNNSAVRKTAESIMTDFIENFVATEAKYCSAKIDSDSVSKSETNEEAQQYAYENMYAQWLRVVDENRALVSENAFLIDSKYKSKNKV